MPGRELSWRRDAPPRRGLPPSRFAEEVLALCMHQPRTTERMAQILAGEQGPPTCRKSHPAVIVNEESTMGQNPALTNQNEGVHCFVGQW